jgi:hypothetical protein
VTFNVIAKMGSIRGKNFDPVALAMKMFEARLTDNLDEARRLAGLLDG